MTHGKIAVVAPEHHLRALGDHVARLVDTGVDRRLRTATANGLDLGDRVRHLEKARAPGEEMCQKVGAQTEAEHGDPPLVDDAAQLVDLLFCEELTFVRDDDVDARLLGRESFEQIVLGRDRRARGGQPDARENDVLTVAVVG